MLHASFRSYLTTEKNYSAHTLEAYLRDLGQLNQYLSGEDEARILFTQKGAATVTHRKLRNWMGDLMATGLTNRSVARKLSSVKSYFGFLQRSGILETNPATTIKVPNQEKRLPSFLKEQEMGALLDGELFPTSFEGIRDRCMFEVLYGCGLRRAELIGLKRMDVDLYQRSIRVKGKGNKERILPFGKAVYEAIQLYLAEAEAHNFSLDTSFFVRKDGKPFYPKLVYRIVRKYLDQMSTLKQRSPHVLRHTFATHLLDQGADLNAIKELLGHKSLASTQTYTHNTISKLKSVHNQAHPRATNSKEI